MIFKLCLGFFENKQEAEDMAQEVFISAYESLENYAGNSEFSTWLYRVAINVCLNNKRKKKIEKIFNRVELKENIESYTQTPECEYIEKEEYDTIISAIANLPNRQQIAFVLSKYNDFTQKEIADIMNINEGAVESLLQRAKQNLRKKLNIK